MDLLIVERDGEVSKYYSSLLREVPVRATTRLSEALSIIEACKVRLVILGNVGNCEQAVDVLRRLRRANNAPDVILIAEHSNEDLAISALRAGAWDYLRTPLAAAEIQESVTRWIETRPPQADPEPHKLPPELDGMVGTSTVISRLRADIAKVAESQCTVLITGETGTGKEMVADLIHAQGSRSKKTLRLY